MDIDKIKELITKQQYAMDLQEVLKIGREIKSLLNTPDNSDYAKCSQEIFDSLFYNHDYSTKDKIESIIKKYFDNKLSDKTFDENVELLSDNSDYAKCKSIGCQFYDEKMEFNCCANENMCEKCIKNQHFS